VESDEWSVWLEQESRNRACMMLGTDVDRGFLIESRGLMIRAALNVVMDVESKIEGIVATRWESVARVDAQWLMNCEYFDNLKLRCCRPPRAQSDGRGRELDQ